MPLISLTKFIEKKLGSKNTSFSVETLSQALELTSEGATTKDEQKILQGIVNFGNTETVQIMKPRIDIFALSYTETYENVLSKILENGGVICFPTDTNWILAASSLGTGRSTAHGRSSKYTARWCTG